MPTTIKLKNSVTTTNAPSSLEQGEVAINITDKKVWVGNAATTPIQLLGDGGSGTFTSLTVTGVATFSAGTVSAPSITTTGDTNTGMYFPAADTIAFTEGGVESMRIDSSGRLGIGTSSPYTPLDVNGYFSAGVRNTTNFPVASVAQHYFGSSPSDLLRNNVVFNINTDATTPPRLRFYKSRGTSASPTATNSGDLTGEIQTSTYDGTGFIQATGIVFGLSANSTTNNVSSYMSFATNGGSSSPTERMRIDSSGNVGIGTSSPDVKLSVVGSAATQTAIKISGSTTAAGFLHINNTGGNFYIGKDNSAGTSFGAVYGSVLYSDGAYPMVFWTNASERMRIDSSGRIGINTTDASAGRVTIKQSTGLRVLRIETVDAGTVDAVQFVKTSGGIAEVGTIQTSTTGTLYNTTSDYRLKENVNPMVGALAKVTQLNPVTYKWKANGSDGQGFIAHELAEVFPDAVAGEKDGINEDGSIKPQGIDTSVLVATLAAAIQELNAKVEAQAAEIALLKSK